MMNLQLHIIRTPLHLSILTIYVDGQQFPAKPLQPRAVGYAWVLPTSSSLWRYLKNRVLAIDRENFLNGYMLYTFNLTPDEECSQD